jgi:hypothetical protein
MKGNGIYGAFRETGQTTSPHWGGYLTIENHQLALNLSVLIDKCTGAEHCGGAECCPPANLR